MVRKTLVEALFLFWTIHDAEAALRGKSRKLNGRRLNEISHNVTTTAEILLPYNPSFSCPDTELSQSLDACFDAGADKLPYIIASMPGISFTDGFVETELDEGAMDPPSDGFNRRSYRGRGYSNVRLSKNDDNDSGGFVIPGGPADGALDFGVPSDELGEKLKEMEVQHAEEIAEITGKEHDLISLHLEEYATFKEEWTVSRDLLIQKWYDMTNAHSLERKELWDEFGRVEWEELQHMRDQLIEHQMADNDVWMVERDDLIKKYLDDYQLMYTRQQTQLGALEETLKFYLARHDNELEELKKQYANDTATPGETDELSFLMGQLEDDDFKAVMDRYELELQSLCSDELQTLVCYSGYEAPTVLIEFEWEQNP